MHRHFIASFFALMILTFPALAAERLTLSTGMREPWTNAQQTGFHNQLAAELFRRLGLDAQVVFNPAASRALQLANDGIDDGLAGRITGLSAEYPNLIQVPEPAFTNDFVAASLPASTATVRNWSDLAPYSVAYILGWQVFENNVPKTRDLTLVKDSKQLLQLLSSGRADLILHERWQVLWHAHELGMGLAIQEPPLNPVPMYIYLHRRHAALVDKAAAELRAMKADGTHKAITGRAFADLAP
jgi:polar amino acid transport system substrate-binding protein